MAVFISMIPCSAGVRAPSAQALSAALKDLFASLPAPTGFDGGGDGPLMLDLGGARVAIMSIDKPIPWSELESRCQATRFWPEAQAALRPHDGHLIVTTMGELTPLAGHTVLTQVTAALLRALPAALGVYWGGAGTLLRKDVFVELARAMTPDSPPTMIWVDIATGAHADGGSRGYTRGLAGFGLREFEAPHAPEPPRQLYGRLEAIAGYSLINGPAIQPGHTVGGTADEKVRVIDAASGFGNPGRVLRLVFEEATGSAARASWLSRLLGRRG